MIWQARPDGSYWMSQLRDDTTRTVTTYTEDGTVTSTRPYTVAENEAADAALVAAEAVAAREADRAAIVEDALVWLAQDAAAADVRAAQIAAAITSVDTQIAQVAAYTFSGSNVAQVNLSLNNALKPMVQSILERQRDIGLMLQELQVARNRHGDALVWVGRYLTR